MLPKTRSSYARKLFASIVAASLVYVGMQTGSTLAVGHGSLANTETTIVGNSTVLDGQAMNYAVNIDPNSSVESFGKALEEVDSTDALLQSYRDIRSFFVQSSDAVFAQKFGKKLANLGIAVTSIGPTRTAPIEGRELLVQTKGADADQLSTAQNEPVAQSRNSNSTHENRSEFNAVFSAGIRTAGQKLENGSDYKPDPIDSYAWGLSAVGAHEAAQVDVNLTPVTVGIIDTGVDGEHPDLKNQIDHSSSVGCSINGIPDTSQEGWQPESTGSSHGTHVAGTVAAAHNGDGVSGVNPRAKIAAIKAANAKGAFYPEYVACAFVWAGDHHFSVTNNSYYMDPWAFWMPNDPSQAAGLEVADRAIRYSHSKGVLNIAAQGNANMDYAHLTTESKSPNDSKPITNRPVSGGTDVPSMIEGVVSVSALQLPSIIPVIDAPDEQKMAAIVENMTKAVADGSAATGPYNKSTFSNYGENIVDVAAPGSYIVSDVSPKVHSVKGKLYDLLSGTSMASPHAAGVASLIRSVNPTLTPAQAADLLRKQASYPENYSRLEDPAKTDGKEYRGHGLVSALTAVTKDQPKPIIGRVSYQKLDGTWADLSDAVVPAGNVKVRVSITGPVTKSSLTFQKKIIGTSDGSGEFAQEITMEGTVDTASLSGRVSELVIDARGRNNDPRSDGKASQTISFTVTRVPSTESSDRENGGL